MRTGRKRKGCRGGDREEEKREVRTGRKRKGCRGGDREEERF